MLEGEPCKAKIIIPSSIDRPTSTKEDSFIYSTVEKKPPSVVVHEADHPNERLSVVKPASFVDSRSLSNISERVRKLLESLEGYDSLYLCPIDKSFPDVVKKHVNRHCVYKYEIKDYYGVTRFYAAELTSRCNYCFCSNARSFQIEMYEPSGHVNFEAVRKCTVGLCIAGVDCCCLSKSETNANFRNSENYIGSVVSSSKCATPVYRVQNEYWGERYLIRGPKCGSLFPCRLCYIPDFPICIPKTNTSMGKIMYGYDGLQEERIPNPKTVGVIFPPRCSPEIKACLLAAGFMLDVTYFQKRGCTCHRILRYICCIVLIIVFFTACYFLVNSFIGWEVEE